MVLTADNKVWGQERRWQAGVVGPKLRSMSSKVTCIPAYLKCCSCIPAQVGSYVHTSTVHTYLGRYLPIWVV